MSDGASNGTPGLPPDFTSGALSSLLNDPAILEMAEALQRDPAFVQMQQVLQQSFASTMGGVGVPPGANPAAGGTSEGGSAAQVQPEKAFEAMQELYSNPQFLEMAEKIGQTMLEQNPVMSAMLDPARREAMQSKFEDLKKDPEFKSVMEELESGDPQAMMKYWNNPDVLKKFSEAVQDVLGETADEDKEEGAEDDESLVPSMQLYAGEGNVKGLAELLKQGVSIDDQDEEGRTGFHFACGYGEIECMKFFFDHGADIDLADNNKNTAMHYAAGYGQEEAVRLLLEKKCNLSLKNEDGNTAKEVAELNEKQEIVKLLEEGMAQQGIANLSVA